jgi:hypothetical protein
MTIAYQNTIPLRHDGDCKILGITPQMALYVEEIYGDDDWLAQYSLTLDNHITRLADEDHGENTRFSRLTLPADLIRPAPITTSAALNFTGPRQRGLREPERIHEIVRPLTIATRMQVIQQLGLDLLPPMLLGIAESMVIAEALIPPMLVCRRLRLDYALTTPQRDSSGQPYVYDTLVLHVAHVYETDEIELPPETVFAGLPGVTLLRPMDCLVYNDTLIVADGGTSQHNSQIHVWQITP